MNITVISKLLLTLIVHSCVTAIIVQTPKARHLTLIYEAGVDILMTCYANPPGTVGIAGDSDGSFLRLLQSKYLVPVVLVDTTGPQPFEIEPILYGLKVFVFVTNDAQQLLNLLLIFRSSIWWNNDANCLVLNTISEEDDENSNVLASMLYSTVPTGVINMQYIWIQDGRHVIIYNVNPFTRYAPKTWRFLTKLQALNQKDVYVFARLYRKGFRNCKDINFDKTIDIGGYPLRFVTVDGEASFSLNMNNFDDTYTPNITDVVNFMAFHHEKDLRWLIDNIVNAMKGTAIITDDKMVDEQSVYISVLPMSFSSPRFDEDSRSDRAIFSLHQLSYFAITQHTAHKSQIEKILTVIDGPSRIGMYIVYIVTFLFFKFFLRQAVVPAILNLVRLTCDTGLTTLPKNLAPTIYLACLFSFVVTFQGIFTGNLASLLTTTIAYPHVNTRQDIVTLNYTVYTSKFIYRRLTAYPNFESRVIQMKSRLWMGKECTEYILSSPLATCVVNRDAAIYIAYKNNFHVSKSSIFDDFTFYPISLNNPFGRRLQTLMSSIDECGLRRQDHRIEKVGLEFVDDDEVKKNTVRRVMTMEDLMFAFVILFIGLASASVCFISELVIFRVRLKMAKRRKRARARLAWGPTETNWFSSLNFRFNARRLFSKRR